MWNIQNEFGGWKVVGSQDLGAYFSIYIAGMWGVWGGEGGGGIALNAGLLRIMVTGREQLNKFIESLSMLIF